MNRYQTVLIRPHYLTLAWPRFNLDHGFDGQVRSQRTHVLQPRADIFAHLRLPTTLALSKSPFSPFAATRRQPVLRPQPLLWSTKRSISSCWHSGECQDPTATFGRGNPVHCPTLNIMRSLSCSAAASSDLCVFSCCVSHLTERATHTHPLHPAALASVPYGIVLVRNWPLVLVPGVNPFGRPELRCSGQCGDLNPLNPTRSTQ